MLDVELMIWGLCYVASIIIDDPDVHFKGIYQSFADR
jgi:hypothetical protein